jgi:hypothetical protein
VDNVVKEEVKAVGSILRQLDSTLTCLEINFSDEEEGLSGTGYSGNTQHSLMLPPRYLYIAEYQPGV